MREIKFRAWDKKENKFVTMYEGGNICFMLGGDYWGYVDEYIGETLYPGLDKKSFIISQFTGLKDKNKKEIYESDILKIIINGIKRENTVVEWRDYLWYPFGDGIPPDYAGTELEVVGNIYENPELLKE